MPLLTLDSRHDIPPTKLIRNSTAEFLNFTGESDESRSANDETLNSERTAACCCAWTMPVGFKFIVSNHTET